ncbi:MAG TPA: ABC transporter substrate-binding protein [Burkholderiales bacterium]|nr:ABC transporter substrate-binding protein [Burkholderiales bacterium]
MHRKICVAAALAAAFALPALAQRDAGGGGTILIGQSVPLSGSNKDLGEDIREGALAYLKKVNDAGGGVNGRKIELVSLDDANDTKRSETNTKTLIDQGVLALFGYGSATLSRPAMPHVEAARITFMAPFTGADPMRVFNRFVYNHRASYADEMEKVVDHYTTFGIKRFAIVHYDDAIGKANFGAVERALKARNLSVVAVASLQRTQADIFKDVAKVMQANPDVVITTTLYKHAADFVKLSRKQGSGAQFISNSFPGSTALAAALGADGLGVAMTQVVPTVTKRSIPIVKEYQEAVEKMKGKKDYSFQALEAYIAMRVLVEGIRRAGPQPTREKLLQAMDTLQNFDLGGYVVNFTPNNHNGSNYVGLTILGRDLAFKD